MHRSPPVLKLDLHLENEQQVFFGEGEAAAEEALERAASRDTKLLAYFKANRQYPEARDVLYPDFPEKFIWQDTARQWKKRSRGIQIGRIPVISLSPQQSEQFYLRMLLYNKAGATSHEDLRTVDGEVCVTFQLACQKLGLLEDDSFITQMIDEAATIQFGNTLRDFFVTILLYNRPANVPDLWIRYRETLSSDYARHFNLQSPDETCFNQCLIYIGRFKV